jgi:hypothetical protein
MKFPRLPEKVDRDVLIAISETKYRAEPYSRRCGTEMAHRQTARSTWLLADEVVGKIMRRAQL